MAEVRVTFYNKISLRTQAQIFKENMLISTGVVDPGGSCTLVAETGRYDIFCKNGVTGWELARQLDSEAKVITLSRHKGRYVIR